MRNSLEELLGRPEIASADIRDVAKPDGEVARVIFVRYHAKPSDFCEAGLILGAGPIEAITDVMRDFELDGANIDPS